MRLKLTILLAGTLLASACQLPLTGVTPASRTKASAQPKKDVASPAPSSSPAPTPSPGPSASPVASATPSAPAVPTTLLKGLVKIDPGYVIQTGGGNFVATNGGTVIATGGGNVISVGGGNVISVGGGNVISTGGGNVISTGGGNYLLLQADGAERTKPVQGMGVVAVSLTTGQPLGQAVFTDAQGRYAVSVPESIKENVLILAAFPGKSADDPILKDPRLQLSLVLNPARTDEAQVSEEVSVVTTYLRKTFQDKFEFFFTPEALATGNVQGLDKGVPPAMKPLVDALITRMQDAAKAAQVPSGNVARMARHNADLLLAHLELDSIKVEKESLVTGADASLVGTPVIPLLTEISRDIQNAVGYRMTTEKQTLEQITATWGLAAINQARVAAGQAPYDLKTPADVGGFIISEFGGKDDKQFEKLKPIWAELGLDEKKRVALDACAVSVGIRMGFAILLNEKNPNDPNDPGIQERVIGDVAKFGPEATP